MSVLENVALNDEGFLSDASVWNEEIATALAEAEGITLTDAHWNVIKFSREAAGNASGASPTLRQITQGVGITTKELFQLFPKGPAKKVAKIAGLGKPEGCV